MTMSQKRKEQILMAIARELDRQTTSARPDAGELSTPKEENRYLVTGEIDIVALAAAVDQALDAGEPDPATASASPKGAYLRVDEGKKPDELNASNDE
jgi:hypothetical protein